MRRPSCLPRLHPDTEAPHQSPHPSSLFPSSRPYSMSNILGSLLSPVLSFLYWGALSTLSQQSLGSQPKTLPLREEAAGPRQRKCGERTEAKRSNGHDPERPPGGAWGAGPEGRTCPCRELGQRGRAKGAGHRAIHRGPEPGSFPLGLVPGTKEGLGFSKALSPHGFLGR